MRIEVGKSYIVVLKGDRRTPDAKVRVRVERIDGGVPFCKALRSLTAGVRTAGMSFHVFPKNFLGEAPRVKKQGKAVVERCRECDACQEWKEKLVKLADGLIERRRSRKTGFEVSIYDSAAQGLDTGEDTPDNKTPYTLVCEEHNMTMGVGSLKIARNFLGDPTVWCEVCSGAEKEDES